MFTERRAVRRVVAALGALVLAGALSACGDDGNGSANPFAPGGGGGDAEVPEGFDPGDVNPEDFTDGDLSEEDLSEAAEALGVEEIPEGFPDDVPLPPEHEVTLALGDDRDGSQEFQVHLTVPSPPSEVAAFFESGLRDEGWSVDRVDPGAGFQITATQDDREVVVNGSGDPAGTGVLIFA